LKFPVFFAGSVYKKLKHFETLHASQFSHSIVKMGIKHSDHLFNKKKRSDLQHTWKVGAVKNEGWT
jgi:mRNA-degrading endonuclease RelE of RelBE toxin-antitoxin system